MKKRIVIALSALGLAVGAANAQELQRQAAITGGGNADRGKCTVEVTVDGAAEVEIRGSTARLRNLSGRPAQWRRFECSSPMPSSPANFRFVGVDGRGRQDLTRDPRNGGVAVIRIEDKDNGRESYTFDIEWGGGLQGGQAQGQYPQGQFPQGQYPQNAGPRPGSSAPYGQRGRERNYPDDRNREGWRESDYYRRNGHGFAVDEAVRVCQDAVARQARSRFPRSSDVHFRYTSIDDEPGRQDWVIGAIDLHRPGRQERYNFSCAVDFNTGRVRSAVLDARPVWR